MKSRELTEFGAEVKKALIDKRMSQVELADTLGIKKQYLNLILYGDRSGEKYVSSIATLLDIDPSILIRQTA